MVTPSLHRAGSLGGDKISERLVYPLVHLYLIAKAFPTSGRHKNEAVLASQSGINNLSLIGPECCVAEYVPVCGLDLLFPRKLFFPLDVTRVFCNRGKKS